MENLMRERDPRHRIAIVLGMPAAHEDDGQDDGGGWRDFLMTLERCLRDGDKVAISASLGIADALERAAKAAADGDQQKVSKWVLEAADFAHEIDDSKDDTGDRRQ
jgi:hypothetical protein